MVLLGHAQFSITETSKKGIFISQSQEVVSGMERTFLSLVVKSIYILKPGFLFSSSNRR